MASQLSLALLKLFSQGELAGTQVQILALAAWNDGWGRRCPLGQRLKGAGNSGLSKGNCARDVIRAAKAFDIFCTKAMPHTVTLPNGCKIQMYLPHEVFAGTAASTPVTDLCVSPESLNADRGLGSLMREWAGHRDVHFAGNLSQVAAIGLHADGVQYTSSLRA